MKKIFPCLLALTLALTLVLSGCGQDSYTTTLSADKVADKLLEVLSGRYHGADADYISESRFGANYRDLTEKCYDHIILLSDDEETNIDQIGVFHVINKSDVSGVADAVTSFVEAEKLRLRDLLTSYNPGELPKLEQAQVKVAAQAKKYEKVNRDKREKIHLLSGILKCPVCGAGMYGNVFFADMEVFRDKVIIQRY